VLKNVATTKGDIVAAPSANNFSRLGVGSNGQVLTADSTQTLGVKWATPSAGSSGALTLLSTSTLSGTGTFDVSSISGSYNDLVLVLIARSNRASQVTDQAQIFLNGDTSTVYYGQYVVGAAGTASAAEGLGLAGIRMAYIPAANSPANSFGVAEFTIFGYASTTWLKSVTYEVFSLTDTTTGKVNTTSGGGTWNSTAAVTRVQVQALQATSNLLVSGSQLRIYGRL
jgi:hypothetical protein